MKNYILFLSIFFFTAQIFGQTSDILTINKKGFLVLNKKPVMGGRNQLKILFEKVSSGQYASSKKCIDDKELILVTLSDGSTSLFYHVPDNTWKFVTTTHVRESGEDYTLNTPCVCERRMNLINLSLNSNIPDGTHLTGVDKKVE